MERAGNSSDSAYGSQLSALYNSSASFCGNFTDGGNATSFAEARCDGDTGSPEDDTNPVIIAIVITALYSMVCVVGLVGNVLVMYIIVRYTKMKTATNIYIFNLALADALVTSTLPFQSVNYLMGTWPFGDALCKMVMSIDYYNMFTSIFTLTTMSIDRYVAVCHPVKALDFRTPHNAKIVNVCNWILSSAIGLPVMFMASTAVTSSPCAASSIVDCKLIFPHPSWYWDTLLKICVFIFAFIMPVLIITVCYGLMILRLKSVRMLSGSQEKDRNLRRITRMVLVVVAVFIVCWTPIHIFVIITALINIPSSTLQTITWHFCIALGYTNSSLNPVLYGYLDENFKRCFREFCTPSPSVLEMQNSSRTGATSRKLPQRENISANTGERSNQQV
ncbi:mu-type opioid receptor isoform X1 [Acanthopagrus latus]|uniref:mu-type opioid receptor isoform X1 n=1 Tax=Acanthopagrus latus TaxID=8177 RepID=UPI00187C94DF|nr:mu-type opioid receptor isoform X1 [Acanthopagrus latus]